MMGMGCGGGRTEEEEGGRRKGWKGGCGMVKWE